MNRRNAIKLTAALVLLLILAALISPALAGNEIVPEAPKVAAYRPTVIPRAPEIVATEPSEIESFGEALEAAKAEVDDELAEWLGRAIWGEAGRCLSSTCISRATACATISARNTEAGNIGERDN